MKSFLVFIFVILADLGVYSQQVDTVLLKTTISNIEGTLTIPESCQDCPIVLLISGSGPTDRDGNNPTMTNNSLKMIAEQLSGNGIASLRYDKRMIGRSVNEQQSEAQLRFGDYVNDAKAWIELMESRQEFGKIIVAGHSEGSLVGLSASQNNQQVDAFVSIAGAGRNAYEILKEQFSKSSILIRDTSLVILDELYQGDTISKLSPLLFSVFRPSVQPYIISWMKYEPANLIANLTIPTLIIQGTTDIQVSVRDAVALDSAATNSRLVILEEMNHVLKNAPEDLDKNLRTYYNSKLPLHNELMPVFLEFVKQLN